MGEALSCREVEKWWIWEALPDKGCVPLSPHTPAPHVVFSLASHPPDPGSLRLSEWPLWLIYYRLSTDFLKMVRPFGGMMSNADSQHIKQMEVSLVWWQLGFRVRVPLSCPPFQNAPEAFLWNPTVPRNTLGTPLILPILFLEQTGRRKPREAAQLAQGHSGSQEQIPGLDCLESMVCVPCVLYTLRSVPECPRATLCKIPYANARCRLLAVRTLTLPIAYR